MLWSGQPALFMYLVRSFRRRSKSGSLWNITLLQRTRGSLEGVATARTWAPATTKKLLAWVHSQADTSSIASAVMLRLGLDLCRNHTLEILV
jgi:hypothetical protein